MNEDIFNVFCISVCSVRSKPWLALGFPGGDTPMSWRLMEGGEGERQVLQAAEGQCAAPVTRAQS